MDIDGHGLSCLSTTSPCSACAISCSCSSFSRCSKRLRRSDRSCQILLIYFGSVSWFNLERRSASFKSFKPSSHMFLWNPLKTSSVSWTKASKCRCRRSSISCCCRSAACSAASCRWPALWNTSQLLKVDLESLSNPIKRYHYCSWRPFLGIVLWPTPLSARWNSPQYCLASSSVAQEKTDYVRQALAIGILALSQ